MNPTADVNETITLESRLIYNTDKWDGNLYAVLSLTQEQLVAFDIALLNLFAATGLPGFDSAEIGRYLATLNQWADVTAQRTKAWYPQFASNPTAFDNSPGTFKMMALATVLQRDLCVHYNLPFSEGDYDGRDSRDHFLHGTLSGHGGTCVTMPVLYVAVGRRLGYPLYLAFAKQHVFVRWAGEGERFNIEATSRGYLSHDDEYYKKWPFPIAESEIERGDYLRNLDPREELAFFLGERAIVFRERLMMQQAVKASCEALSFAPNSPFLLGALRIHSYLNIAFEQTLINDSNRAIDLHDIHLPKSENAWQRETFQHALHHLNRLKRIYPKGTIVKSCFPSPLESC